MGAPVRASTPLVPLVADLAAKLTSEEEIFLGSGVFVSMTQECDLQIIYYILCRHLVFVLLQNCNKLYPSFFFSKIT